MTNPIYEIPFGDGVPLPTPTGRRSQPAAPVQPPLGSTGQSLPPLTYDAPAHDAPAHGAPATYPQSFPGAMPPAPTSAPVYAAPPPPQSAADLYAGLASPSQVPGSASVPAAVKQPIPSIDDFLAPPLPQVQSFAAPANTAPAKQYLSDRAPSTGEGQAGSDQDLVAALNAVVTAGASDLHVTVNAPPMVRIDGALRPVADAPVWSAEKVTAALHSIMTPRQLEIFEEALELDFAYTLSETSRFRVNFYQQRNVIGAAFRLIPTQIKQLAALGVPEKIAKFSQLPRGLVLVTGPTGSGKSTTLAALIDLVNSTRADHIVTVEDPIEFMHQNKKALVNQREVGHDTHSFNNALKHVLRQDPDVILIGELRDLETISVALTAAETGHLVFATLHTQDAAQTIDRIIDVFPPHQQGQVRAQLAATLQGVVCQTLVKKVGGGRAVATEVLITTSAIANLIREGKTYQIHSVMQAGRDLGMHTMDQHLADLVNAGQISHQAAYDKAHDLEDLKQLIQRVGTGTGDSINQASKSGEIDFGDSFSNRGV